MKCMRLVFSSFQMREMIGPEELAVQNTEPDIQLIQPRGVGRQPAEFNGHGLLLLGCLLVQPGLEALRSSHYPESAAPCRRGVATPLAESRPAGRLGIRQSACGERTAHRPPHRRRSAQQTGTLPLSPVARGVALGMTSHGGLWRPLSRTSLDGGFLVQTEQPCARLQQRLSLRGAFQD